LYARFLFQAEDGIRAFHVTGVQTCALPILSASEAVEWGLVAEAVAGPSTSSGSGTSTGSAAAAEADAVRERAEQVARFWLAGAAGAYGQAKRLVRSQPSRAFAEQLAEEARTLAAAFATPEAEAGVAGFAAG